MYIYIYIYIYIYTYIYTLIVHNLLAYRAEHTFVRMQIISFNVVVCACVNLLLYDT